MKKGIVNKLAKKYGFISILEHQNNQLGSGLLSQFEQAIADSEEHAEVSKEIAEMKKDKATRINDEAKEKAMYLQERAATKLRRGKVKSDALNKSAKTTIDAGVKSAKFAKKLKELVS